MALDISAIKQEIKSLLVANNTTTSSVFLSNNMTTRVKKVYTVNPEKIELTANATPYVTIYTDRKSIEQADIARNQAIARRQTDLTLNIVGALWNQNFSADITKDPADDDLEYLMENIEEVLRQYPDLEGNVSWQVPEETDYFSMPIDEDSHFRAARLKLKCRVFY